MDLYSEFTYILKASCWRNHKDKPYFDSDVMRKLWRPAYWKGERIDAVGWDTALQAGSLRFRLSMRSWDFSLPSSFRPHCGPGIDPESNRNEYQEYFLGSKGGWYVALTQLYHLLEIWEPELPGNLRTYWGSETESPYVTIKRHFLLFLWNVTYDHFNYP
jgi:hypothetical protein